MKDTLKFIVFGGLFLVLLLPLYVENNFFFPYITGKNFAFRIIVEIVSAAWILLALFEVKYRPKFSWIIVTFSVLLIVMVAANILGEYPFKSFWSNFERMDGYITLVHVFLFTVVLGSVMTTQKLWSYFLHTSLVIALLVALYGLAQHQGIIQGGQSRVDSRLGNAAYMAVYMLFHIFFVYFLILRSKITTHKVLYGIAGLVLAYTLLLTGTRGTFLGLIGGSGAAVVYIALFGRKFPELRKYAVGGLILLSILGLSFIAARDTSVIQNTPALSRIANINLQSDLVVRKTIWSVAWEGIKERPLLGWGQGNFNYVFNTKYDATLYAQEQWFDRVHNIVFDWLIAGGFLGLIAYFSIMLAALYYLLIAPVFLKKESQFSVLERAVLFGLVVGYLMHNLVVFDNIISYIFYGTLLALIHARVATPIEKVESYKIEPVLITQFVTPIVIIVAGFSVYMLNVPGILASKDMINALRAPDVLTRLQAFDTALEQRSFANQEIVEQLAQQAMTVAGNQKIPQKDRDNMVQRAELELLKLNDEKPGDARLHNFLSSFYRAIGALKESQREAAIATSLSPNKPTLVLEQAIVELQLGNEKNALAFLKQTFELEEDNSQARVLYAAQLINMGSSTEAKALISDAYEDAFAQNAFALSSVEKSGDLVYLAHLFTLRIAKEPKNPQYRASLAFIYYQLEDIDKAVEILNTAGEEIPSFTEASACYAANLKAGNKPDEGCS